MKLSVVILNYNVRYFLEMCLQSVQSALAGISAEIIVVDNDSVDDSCTMIKRYFPNVILIENKNNIGFSRANNQAVKVAQGEFVCILNPDTVVAEDTFHKILDFVSDKPKLGILGCRMINGLGNFLPESKRNVPTIAIALQKLFGYSKHYYTNHLSEKSTGEVDILTGAFMIMERSLYDKLQGFDEDFFMYGEDIDLCYRAKKIGRKNYYFADTSIIHFKGESTLKDKTYLKWFYGAMQLFHDKHFKSNFILNFAVRLATELIPQLMPKLENRQSIFSKSKDILILEPHSESSVFSKLDIQTISNINMLSSTKKTDLILDANSQTYKAIIDQIQSIKKPNIFFKIWPKKAMYFVGSDSSNRRGEVVHFDEFEYRSYF